MKRKIVIIKHETIFRQRAMKDGTFNNLFHFPNSLAIDQEKCEYEKRCLMRSWSYWMEDGKEKEAKGEVERIEAGEEK
jgi:hypothetical protein